MFKLMVLNRFLHLLDYNYHKTADYVSDLGNLCFQTDVTQINPKINTMVS